jgi:uncharacterized protein
MRWNRRGRRSANIEDRRGRSGGIGGLPIPLPGGAGGGIVGVVLLIALTVLGRGCLTGGGDGGDGFDVTDLTDLLQQFPTASPAGQGESPLDEGHDPDADLVDFVSFVLDDVQGFWDGHFAEAGENYPEADLVLFRQATQSGCGPASSATGPFYCPADSMVYLDLGFFEELGNRFDAPGDFAQAYVLAHELGHHVQNVLGIDDDVRRLQQEDPDRVNELSVRQELQADCLAGVWAHSAFQRDLLSEGDLAEGLDAAAAVGDDRIQESTSGRVNPETFTHGTSEQRVHWFRTGYDTGDVDACDTFTPDEDEL